MRVISAVLASVSLLAVATSAQDADPGNPSLLKASFSRLPIYFVENRGVYPDDVAFTVQGADKTLFFTKDGITFRLKGKDRPWVVKLDFVGANPDARPRGEDRQQAVFSYFKGREKDWKTGLETYAEVVYEDLWPGIDLVYRGTVNRLKYEFVVAPGADPRQIRLRFAGATAVQVLDSGALRVETPEGSFEDAPPVAWQEIEGERRPVAMAFEPADRPGGTGREFVFRVGDYDRCRTLVLDPAILVYCGYIGGAGLDDAFDIAVDSSGHAYVTGSTASTEKTFPVKVGPDVTLNGNADAFVAKVNAAGTGLVYCGYIGGSNDEYGHGISVDAAGNAYVAGSTTSTDTSFPVRVGPDLTHNGGADVFVAKVNASGTALVYCGYIGGSLTDAFSDIAVDAAGSAYVTGRTWSNEQSFPVRVGPDLTYNGGFTDVFVAKVNAQGTALAYCGYIGGALTDYGGGIAVDAAGSTYVTGLTESNEKTFPVKVGPDLTHNGEIDAFVAKVNGAGTALAYCGYIGGAGGDSGQAIAVDAAGSAYVTGDTTSNESTFPVAIGPDLTHNAGWLDAFVAKVNTQGTGLDYCGYIGGNGVDDGRAIAVDDAGNTYVTGITVSNEKTFPVKVGPDLTYNGDIDTFVAKVNGSGRALSYCGYIGGPSSDSGQAIAVDTAGNAYVTGITLSDEKTFPVTVGPDLTHNGGRFAYDAFVAKIALTLLEGPSAVHPGGTVTLDITAGDDVGLLYQVASSFGTGPISIDTRKIRLSPDPLFYLSTWNVFPGLFVNYAGRISPNGRSLAFLNTPNVAAVIGLRIHSAFVTLDPAAPSGVKSISNTSSFTITQ